MKKNNLTWNVYICNNNEIKIYNIFNHSNFMKDLIKIKTHDMNEFEKEIKKLLQYFFCCKAEWEITITSFPVYTTDKKNDSNAIRNLISLDVEQKVNVYDQILLNWNSFLTYLWRALH